MEFQVVLRSGVLLRLGKLFLQIVVYFCFFAELLEDDLVFLLFTLYLTEESLALLLNCLVPLANRLTRQLQKSVVPIEVVVCVDLFQLLELLVEFANILLVGFLF